MSKENVGDDSTTMTNHLPVKPNEPIYEPGEDLRNAWALADVLAGLLDLARNADGCFCGTRTYPNEKRPKGNHNGWCVAVRTALATYNDRRPIAKRTTSDHQSATPS